MTLEPYRPATAHDSNASRDVRTHEYTSSLESPISQELQKSIGPAAIGRYKRK